MVTKAENELLTRVCGDAPMGRMIRQRYWIPVAPAVKLEAGGAPLRVRLLGEDYVVFRAGNGRVGFLDERCPHRKASLALARNEDNALRCLFHGWKFSVTGEMVEAPNHVGDQAQFCRNVRHKRYHVVDRGGIVWVWLGQGDEPPRFPDLPFTQLPPDRRAVTSQLVPTNWLQGVEASMDSSHVGVLHESSIQIMGNNQRRNMSVALAPRFEFEERPYGYRYAALRDLPNDNLYVRINNFVLPWYGVICAPEPEGPATAFFSVPVDDENHRAWFVHFNMHQPLGMTNMSASPDVWAYPPLPPGGPDENWGQNRDMMKRGHFSGFPQHLGTEDFAMFMSQGRIYDRTDEHLCSADGAIVRLRRLLLKAVRDFGEGAAAEAEIDYRSAMSIGGVIPASQDWRSALLAKIGTN